MGNSLIDAYNELKQKGYLVPIKMTEFNQNETVTISLERYEQLKNNQKVMTYSFEERAMQKYLEKNGLVFYYTPQDYGNAVEIITKEEAEKRDEVALEKSKKFIDDLKSHNVIFK